MLKKAKQYYLVVVPYLIVMLGLIFIIVLSLNSRQRGLTSATYVRFETCVLNVPASTRSQADINRCWTFAEESTGVKVNHFDQ